VALANKNKGEAKSAAKKGSAKGGSTAARADDLLNSYLKLLSHLPLFTPEEERDYARHLREADIETWALALSMPQGLEYLLVCEGVADFPAIDDLNRLGRCYTRGGLVSENAPRRAAMLEREIIALAEQLRDFDNDRVVLDRVLEHLRGSGTSVPASAEAPKRRGITPDRPTRQQLQKLERIYQEALEIRNKFVRANLRLVVRVARSFHHYRLPLVDLIQEGNLGLIKAVHRFDYRRGFRFSTYAHWWIRQSIERAIVNKGAQVRLPVHVFDTRRQVNRAIRELTTDLGRAPTEEEVSAFLEIPIEKVAEVQDGMLRDPVSIDDVVGDEDERSLSAMLTDRDAVAPDETVIHEDEVERMRELLALLSPIEMDVICRRFGLVGDNDETLEEIGRKYNLSRERVRQIQVQGLKKMRRFCERREIGAKV